MARVLQEDQAPRVHASRVQGPRRVLKSLRRVLLQNRRARLVRADSDEETRWCDRVHDAIDRLIAEGDQVLPGQEDPRDRRRARKRPLPLV